MILHCREPGVPTSITWIWGHCWFTAIQFARQVGQVSSLATPCHVKHLTEVHHKGVQICEGFAEGTSNQIHNVCHAGNVDGMRKKGLQCFSVCFQHVCHIVCIKDNDIALNVVLSMSRVLTTAIETVEWLHFSMKTVFTRCARILPDSSFFSGVIIMFNTHLPSTSGVSSKMTATGSPESFTLSRSFSCLYTSPRYFSWSWWDLGMLPPFVTFSFRNFLTKGWSDLERGIFSAVHSFTQSSQIWKNNNFFQNY